MGLSVKVAAFCRELGDNTLREMAHRDKETDGAYIRTEESLKDGQIGPGLEADLDLRLAHARQVPVWVCPAQWLGASGRRSRSLRMASCRAQAARLKSGGAVPCSVRWP